MPELKNATDEELVVAVREENRELYSQIIGRYGTKLSHYLRKFIRSHDELEDVLQDVFIKAYRNLHGFDASKKFSPWIYRITRNEALNYIKKYSKEVSLEENEMEILDHNFDIQKKMDSTLLKAKVEAALAKMKNKYREPLILYYFEQRSYEEISEILRVPVSTVGVLMLRGKKELKKYLEKTYGK